MTAKEQVLVEAPAWAEEQAQRALRAAHGKSAEHAVDEWGDLDAQTHAEAAAVMRDLDQAERAEFGETIAEAWGRTPKRS